MNVSRRGFLKLSGAVAAVSGLGISLTPTAAHAKELKIKYAKETTTICPYCSVGCSIIVSVRDGKVINTEGDPDSPINKGSLLSLIHISEPTRLLSTSYDVFCSKKKKNTYFILRKYYFYSK